MAVSALFAPALVAATPAATATALTIAQTTLTIGEVETLTAAVTAGGQPVTGGTVTFLDGTSTLGVVQLVSTAAGGHTVGTATLKTIRLTAGTHAVTARYDGDDSDAASTAAAQSITVTGQYPTTTSLASSGSPGKYDLTGTVDSYGAGTPSGNIEFTDQTGSNSLGSVAVDAPSVKSDLTLASTAAVSSEPYAAVVGDFNGDGFPDIATANKADHSISILLGDGKGGFLPARTVAVPARDAYYPAQPEALAVGDFNGDGNEDLVELGPLQADLLLGNGKGDFQGSAITSFSIIFGPRMDVAMGDFNRDGNADVVVCNGDSLRILLGDGTGKFTAASGLLPLPPNVYSYMLASSGMTAADLNGDGNPDLVFSDFSTGRVEVALGNGDGTFRLGWYAVEGSYASAVSLADFNGDGKLDLFIADPKSQKVFVLKNDGAGNFSQVSTVATGNDPTDVATGDFNGDGKLDLAVVNHTDNTLALYDGDGAGTFTQVLTVPAGEGARAVTATDLNGDGRLDALVANDRDDSVEIFDGVLRGTASLPSVAIPGTGIHAVAASYAGDAQHLASPASNPVYLTQNLVATAVALGLQPATGVDAGDVVRLTATVTPSSQNGAVAGGTVTFSDSKTTLGASPLDASGSASLDTPGLTSGSHSFNASYSGDADFAASQTAQAVSLTVASAPGTAAAATAVTLSASPATVTRGGAATLVASVTAGGNPVTDGQVTFLDGTHVLGSAQVVSDASAGFAIGTATLKTNSLGLGTHSVTVRYLGDQLHAASTSAAQTVNVTGHDRLMLEYQPYAAGPNGEYILYGDMKEFGPQSASGTVNIVDQTAANSILFQDNLDPKRAGRDFFAGSPTPTGNGPAMVVTADLNGDGVPDLATPDLYGNTVSILLGDGEGGFALHASIAVGNGPDALATGDFNGDGNADLAVANSIDNTVTILLGDGKGGFTPSSVLPTGKSPSGVATGDVNGDGVPDLVVTNRGDNTASVYLGDGSGGFGLESVPSTGKQPAAVTIADLNADGFADLAIANAEDSTVSILLGNDDGTFKSGSVIPVETDPESIAAGDLNSDGNPDLVVGCSGEAADVLTGDGKGGFKAASTGSVPGALPGFMPSAVAIADLNGDGHPDIAVSDFLFGGFSAWTGDGKGNFTSLVSAGPGLSLAQISGMTVADADGDGMPDIIEVDERANQAEVFDGVLYDTFGMPEMPIPGHGSHVLTATYSGDANYAAAQSSNTITVMATPVTTALTIAAAPLTGLAPEQTTTLTATVKPNQVNGMTASGTVTFNANGTALGTAILQSNGTATLTSPALSAGSHAFRASYAGDDNFVASQTSTAADVWVQAATSTSLAVSSASLKIGDVETLTANVTQGGQAVTGGTVTFLDGSAVMASVQVTSAGAATFSTDTLATGSHSLTARYNAGAATVSSTSAAQTVAVTGTYPSTTTLAASGIPGNIVLTATVAGMGPSVPTGTVTFTDDTAKSTLGKADLEPSKAAVGFAPPSALSLSSATEYAGVTVAADFDGDGHTDLAVLLSGGQTIDLFLGNGDGSFRADGTISLSARANSLATGDFNDDGHLDLVVGPQYGPTMSIYAGDGAGHFSLLSSPKFNAGGSIKVGDFNGDGYADLAVTGDPYSPTLILLGDGKGNFTSNGATSVNASFGNGAMGDFNGDGKLDFAGAGSGGAVDFYLGNGDGTFTKQGSVKAGTEPSTVVTADFNGDGNPDLAVQDGHSGDITILLGDGKGNFTAASTVGALASDAHILTGDFNGDGHTDLLVSSPYSSSVLLLLGDGKGNFNSVTAPIAQSSLPADVANLNGDSLTDLLTPAGAGKLDVLLAGNTVTASLANVAITGTGVHSVSASYAGDPAYSASQSGQPLTFDAAAATPTIALSASENPAHFGDKEMITATVTGKVGPGTPTGAVTFLDYQTKVGTATLDANGTAAYTIDSVDFKTHDYTAEYAGDQNYQSVTTPSPLVVTVDKGAPQVALSGPASTVASGAAVILQVAVTDAASTLPTGKVEIEEGGTSLASAAIDSSGKASVTVNGLSGGQHQLTAVYEGDTNFASATSAAVTVTVAAASVTVALTADTAAPVFGSPVTLTATATAKSGTPDGSVEFDDGSTSLGKVALDASGKASLHLTTLAAGNHSITAAYAGDGAYAGAISTAIAITVAPAPVTLALAASETTGSYGDSIDLTARATSTAGTPSGTVTFTQDGVTLGTADLDNSGQAVLTTKKLPGGTDSVTASLEARGNFAAASSSSLTITLTPAADYQITADTSTLTVKTGQTATANLTLTPVNGFDQSVSLSCGPLPAGVTCGFKPSSVSLASGPGTMALTVSVAATASAPPVLPTDNSNPTGRLLVLTLLGGLALLLAGSGRRRRLAGLMLLGALLAGCGGSPAPASPGTPDILGSHPLTITATSTTGGSGSTGVTHTIPVTIVIQ